MFGKVQLSFPRAVASELTYNGIAFTISHTKENEKHAVLIESMYAYSLQYNHLWNQFCQFDNPQFVSFVATSCITRFYRKVAFQTFIVKCLMHVQHELFDSNIPMPGDDYYSITSKAILCDHGLDSSLVQEACCSTGTSSVILNEVCNSENSANEYKYRANLSEFAILPINENQADAILFAKYNTSEDQKSQYPYIPVFVAINPHNNHTLSKLSHDQLQVDLAKTNIDILLEENNSDADALSEDMKYVKETYKQLQNRRVGKFRSIRILVHPFVSNNYFTLENLVTRGKEEISVVYNSFALENSKGDLIIQICKDSPLLNMLKEHQGIDQIMSFLDFNIHEQKTDRSMATAAWQQWNEPKKW